MKATVTFNAPKLIAAIKAHVEERCYDGTSETKKELDVALGLLGMVAERLDFGHVYAIEVPLIDAAERFEFEP
jgi:hypothetical protein